VSAKADPASLRQNRSGSEKRQRVSAVRVRLLPSERAVVEDKAAEAGMSMASYVRAAMLGDPGIRAKRAPTLNAVLLAQAVAALNKAGSNLNQIAHHLNAGHAAGSAETVQTLHETRAAVLQIIALTGRKGEV
jgi:hypothetical protein